MTNTLLADLNTAASEIGTGTGYTMVVNPLAALTNPVLVPTVPVNLLALSLSFPPSKATTLTLVQSLLLYIVCSGTLTDSWTITFVTFGVWQVDTTGVTFGGHSIFIASGSATGTITTQSIFTVSLPVANKVTVK
jgi:hypothetical protein